jgi:hypothetical protein
MEALGALLALMVVALLAGAFGVGIYFLVRIANRAQVPRATSTTVPPVTASPPGWYPATDGTGRVLYWNGREWSNPPAGGSTATPTSQS